ncbi:GtrA family protein [Parerythrobacter lacustris]|uniref:GtrA family protein n=1 Tax=Parerythrobacter lacustris TaxID=2969984 RepID=A0ABT1XME3_9SPHN|nr:GtrA family protein [Parerythrobacter lacustris]MCR2832417.1 GtrA family protein [Parerythrobacter lacustris]
MSEVLNRLQQLRLLRYGIASVVALAIDMGTFLAFLALAIPPAPASALSYSIGIVTHWLISSRAVFTETVAQRGPQRTRQKALFVGSALVGLTITTLIVGVSDLAGADPRYAKLAAIVVSFAATWLLRSRVVFRAAA